MKKYEPAVPQPNRVGIWNAMNKHFFIETVTESEKGAWKIFERIYGKRIYMHRYECKPIIEPYVSLHNMTRQKHFEERLEQEKLRVQLTQDIINLFKEATGQ